MLGSNTGQLRLRHWLSDKQETRLHIIHSATSHPHSATSHPQLGYISSTTRLHLIHNSATSHPLSATSLPLSATSHYHLSCRGQKHLYLLTCFLQRRSWVENKQPWRTYNCRSSPFSPPFSFSSLTTCSSSVAYSRIALGSSSRRRVLLPCLHFGIACWPPVSLLRRSSSTKKWWTCRRGS